MQLKRFITKDGTHFIFPVTSWMLKTSGYLEMAEFLFKFTDFSKKYNLPTSLRGDLIAFANLVVEIIVLDNSDKLDRVLYSASYLSYYTILKLFSRSPFDKEYPASNLNFVEAYFWKKSSNDKYKKSTELLTIYYEFDYIEGDHYEWPLFDPRRKKLKQYLFLQAKIRKKIKFS